MAIAPLCLKPMFYSSSREAEQLRLQELSLRYASTLTKTPEPTTTSQSTMKETVMTDPIDTENLIRESLRSNYESFHDAMETPKKAHQLLKALRIVHNFYAPPDERIGVSGAEAQAKDFRVAGFSTMGEGLQETRPRKKKMSTYQEHYEADAREARQNEAYLLSVEGQRPENPHTEIQYDRENEE